MQVSAPWPHMTGSSGKEVGEEGCALDVGQLLLGED